MNVRVINEEVLYALDGIVSVRQSDIEDLKKRAAQNVRKRIRLCAHPSESNNLHEMLIVLGKENYIRPHRHPGKSESFHVIEGSGDVIIFDDDGKISNIIRLGSKGSERCCYFRLSDSRFHTLIIHSDVLVFHEVTNGPFEKEQTVMAPFSPPEHDGDAVRVYINHLINEAAQFNRGTPQ